MEKINSIKTTSFNVSGHWSFVMSFYCKQFSLDYLLATYKKPMLAILDGSVMGGGVGISIHSTFRIVTENTVSIWFSCIILLYKSVFFFYDLDIYIFWHTKHIMVDIRDAWSIDWLVSWCWCIIFSITTSRILW